MKTETSEKEIELAVKRNNLCLRCKNASNVDFETAIFKCTCKKKCTNYMYFSLNKRVVHFIPNPQKTKRIDENK